MKTLRSGLSQRLALPVLLGALALPLCATAQGTSGPGPGSGQGAAAAVQGPGSGMGMGMGMGRMQGKNCPMMKHGRMPHMLRMPRLPPGNEKLQLQMEAEILQKIGEIQGKYASQLP